MHKIQKVILKRLYDANSQKYSLLTHSFSYEDNIVFHLKRLIADGLIEKKNAKYLITKKGVQAITNIDLSLLEDTGYKTFFIGFLCQYNDEYLVKEHPQGSVNFYNLPSGKPRFAEKIEKALIRTFFENTGLKMTKKDFEFVSLHLKTVKTKDKEVLFDDAFTIYKVDINKNTKEKMKLANNVHWMKQEEIKKLKNRWPEIDILILKKDFEVYKVYELFSDYILH